MAAPKINEPWQTSTTEVRSVALADQNGWTAGAVKYRWGAPDHFEQFAVLSKTTHRHDYVVTYSIHYDRVVACTCRAGEYGMPCTHRGAVRQWIERRKAQVAFVQEMRDAGQTPYEPTELLSA